jgi:hypothetical protein
VGASKEAPMEHHPATWGTLTGWCEEHDRDHSGGRPWEGPEEVSHMSVPPELAAREGGGNPFVPWPRGRNARVDLYFGVVPLRNVSELQDVWVSLFCAELHGQCRILIIYTACFSWRTCKYGHSACLRIASRGGSRFSCRKLGMCENQVTE